MKLKKPYIFFLMFFIILFLLFYSNRYIEGFENGWNNQLIDDFLKFQNHYNPNYIFDMNIIQKQVTAQEARQYLKTGEWYWSPEIDRIYEDMLERDSSSSFHPYFAIKKAKRIYNQIAIQELLAWNTKEGKFILNGANNLQCNINGQIEYKNDLISPKELPSLLNGFHFIKEPCNPCKILQEDIFNYNCPFTINTGNGNKVSPIWAYLWGIKSPDYKRKKYYKPNYIF
jgi:hypothetical protein